MRYIIVRKKLELSIASDIDDENTLYREKTRIGYTNGIDDDYEL